jgi:hypothetical protein
VSRLSVSTRFEAAVAEAVSAFGAEVAPRLRGPGEHENQLRAPTEQLVRSIADALGLSTVFHGEVRLVDLRARPDYQVDVAEAPVGFIEIKRPGKGAIPESFTDPHDVQQWHKLKLLPNVLYSDGNEWALYRSGQRVGEPARFNRRVRDAGSRLAPKDEHFARVLTDFLRWEPQPPRTIGQLVRAVASLCRLLRVEVRAALELEARGLHSPLFTVLAENWRDLLFPDAGDDAFADQYAQTITFALLLARADGITLDGEDISSIAKKLGKKHSLMGRALDVLTHDPGGGLGVSLDTLIRVIGAVHWDQLDGSKASYLHLYQDFLAVYDAKLRQQTGSYYTANEIVEFMVGFTDRLLRSRLGKSHGYASDDVVVIDPAMGTGTFLLHVLKQVEQTVTTLEGDQAVGPRLRDMARRRLIGFEKQIGPYAVAELRLYEALRHSHSEAPAQGLRIYVTDTLDNPYAQQAKLGFLYNELAASREGANKVKREEPVVVALGNPPHDKVAKGSGKWIETGEGGPSRDAPLEAFRATDKGRYEYALSNLYVYFWRWATWKVFDHHDKAPSGIVALISPSAYLTGQGFAGMRAYLRRTADEGWIIDLSPEGHQPDVATRVFPEVQQPLCIGIFARYGDPRPATPAKIHYLAISGRRQDKFDRLGKLARDDPAWTKCPSSWDSPFRPESPTWTSSPLLADLFPWSSRGVTPGRTWVYAPDKETLRERWSLFLAADLNERRQWFREARDRKLNSAVPPLPGVTPHTATLAEETGPPLDPVQVGHRPFDRKWLLPDNRLMVVPRPDLWRVRGPQQIYTTEQNAHPITTGPALIFSAHIPDMHHYNGRSGRAIPLYQDASGCIPNVAPSLLAFLTQQLGVQINAEDLLAYVAAVVAHPAYTMRFSKELEVPGVRVPLTRDHRLWHEAVRLGQEILWLHTYGERCADPAAGRSNEIPTLPAQRQPMVVAEIPDTETDMPHVIDYRADQRLLQVGLGAIAPVTPEVWAYEVSGWKVVKRWFDYRKKNPDGRRVSFLDSIVPTRWPPQYTTELLALIRVLQRLIDLEPTQGGLLGRICTAPQIVAAELNATGVLPVPPSSRKPMRSSESALGGLFPVPGDVRDPL